MCLKSKNEEIEILCFYFISDSAFDLEWEISYDIITFLLHKYLMSF